MKKLVSSLCAGALLLAACGSGSNAVAATLNGEDITVSDIEALIDTGDESAIEKATFAQLLGFEIQQRIITSAAEDDLGIVVSEDEIAAEADTFVEQTNTSGVSREEFLSSAGVTEEFLFEYAHQQLLIAQVREALAADVAEPTQEEIDGVMTEAEAAYCASHILVATEQEANDVLGRLEAGEDFATLATEVSTDTGSGAVGGDLGCAIAENYVPEFASALSAAEVGVPTQPVETEFGYHVILLREDEVPAEADVIEDLKATAADTATNDWFLEQVEAAEVTVTEEYGTWDSTTPQVVPPTE
ncbi:MAG TPA: peptidylprolyl isomerase [Acidimicrobiia bacterium]